MIDYVSLLYEKEFHGSPLPTNYKPLALLLGNFSFLCYAPMME